MFTTSCYRFKNQSQIRLSFLKTCHKLPIIQLNNRPSKTFALLYSRPVVVVRQGFVTCAFRQAGRQLGKVLWLHGCSPRFIKTTGKLFPVLAIPRVSFPDEFRSNREQYIPLFCACSPQTRFFPTKLTHNPGELARARFFFFHSFQAKRLRCQVNWPGSNIQLA